ncbi:acylphosphatase [Acetilactobacillus jinshanensis]|nr:acylphosphatase [Acetilactobacillus jinshanensis]
MLKTVRMIVSGRVQGVGFRWAAKQVADDLGNRLRHQFN